MLKCSSCAATLLPSNAVLLQAEAMRMEGVQAASQAAAAHLPYEELADDYDMQKLCSELQDRLKPPPEVAVLDSHATLLGQKAVYQVSNTTSSYVCRSSCCTYCVASMYCPHAAEDGMM